MIHPLISSKKNTLRLGLGFFLLLMAPFATHAQAKIDPTQVVREPQTANPSTPVGILPSDLTTKNGWTCNITKSSCTNNLASSPWYKGTASCTVTTIPSPEPGIPDQVETSCTAVAANGTSSSGTLTDNSAIGTVTTSLTNQDKNGGTTAIDVTSTESPIESAAKAATDLTVGAFGCIANGPIDCLVNAVGVAMLGLATLFLGIAGVLFNLVVVKTVFGFATVIGNAPGVLVAWGIVRDIGNMLLLFGFIFMGLNTILDLHSFPTKKAIPRLIIFAILMNFSLFAAEAVIDSSNVFASVMYAQSNSSPCALNTDASAAQTGATDINSANQAAVQDLTSSCELNTGLGGSIMTATGLSTMFKVQGNEQAIQSFTVYVGLTLFALIGAVVMFAASIMLIVRTVTLTFVMVLSPIGFAGMALPMFQGMAKQWWDALLKQAFFAPILLLMILVSLKVSESFAAGSGGNASLAGALMQPNASVMGVILVFVLVIGLLIGSLVMAKRLGAASSEFAVGLGTRVAFGGFARGSNLVVNSSSRAADRGLRKVTARVSNSAFMQRNDMARKAFAGTSKAISTNVLKPLGNSNADLRRIPGLGAALSAAGAGSASKPSSSATLDAMQKDMKNLKEHLKHSSHEYDSEMMVSTILEKAAQGASLTNDEKSFLAKQSVKELEEMKGIKQGIDTLVDNLSPEQFEGLMKSDKLTDSEKGNIKRARYAALSSAIATGGDVGAVTRNMSKNDIEGVPPEILANPAFLNALNDKQRDDLAGSNKRTSSERQLVKNSSPSSQFEAAFAANAAMVASDLRNLTAPQVGKLDKNILTNALVAPYLTPAMLIELQETKKLNAANIQAIAANIGLMGNPSAQRYIAAGGPGSSYWS